MKKNKLTSEERKFAIKRATKRSMRLKKAQKQKNINKTAVIEEKKRIQKKQDEEIEKILKSRNADSSDFSSKNYVPTTFSQYVNLAFWKKNMKLKKKKEQQIQKESTD